MIRVQYFARYREVLGIDGEQLQRAALTQRAVVDFSAAQQAYLVGR